MLTPVDFEQCIRDNLKERHFGKERGDAIIKEFHAQEQYHLSSGEQPTRAAELAMKDVFDRMSFETIEKAKRSAKMISVAANNKARVARGMAVKTGWLLGDGGSGPGASAAIGAKSMIEHDPRVGGENYNAKRQAYFGQLLSTWNDVLDKVGKGAFGVQKGKAHLDNFIREFLGESTGDQTAKEFAAGWRKVSNLIPELMNHVGGSMRRLDDFLPQRQNAARMVGREAEWVTDHMNDLDWSRMRWPDGTMISINEREKLLKFAYDTLSSDGANKIDETAFRGRGRAVGNMLNSHRFMHYKTADGWLKAHSKWGDGTILDVLTGHMDDMSHRIALVDMFGPNPDAGFQNLEAQVRKAAAAGSPHDKAIADAILKNKVRPMYDTIARKNPMDPHSVPGAIVTGASQMAVAAQLGSATLLAAPGDATTAAFVKLMNGMDLFGGVGTYFKALATDPKLQAEIARQSGFIMDDTIMSVYQSTRFTGAATWAPAITKRVSDTVLRASLLSGHTRAARWSVQQEFMGLMARDASTAFSELPYKRMLERFGISEADWNTFRTLPAHAPKDGVAFLRPIDFLNTKLGNRQELYTKWHRVVFDSSREMVPDASVEASVMLRGTTRPDTLVGIISHSFSMYKNFPVSFWMTYSRLGMTSPSVQGRLGFYAGLIGAMTLVGALGTQMREITKGREPMPMNDMKFIGKALMSGGGLSIWGDFLFAGVNEYGRGPQDIVGGPVFSMFGDMTDFALGDVLEMVQDGDADFSPMSKKGVDLLKKYTPGSSLWWARLALERQLWDRLSELADPDVYKRRSRAAKKQKTEYGNSYWYPPKM